MGDLLNDQLLAGEHLSFIGLVVVSQEMQCAVDEQMLDGGALGGGHRGADDDVAELAGHAVGERVTHVERERQHVGRVGLAAVGAVQPPHLGPADDREAHLPLGHPLGLERRRQHGRRGLPVEGDMAAVAHLDGDGHSRALSLCSRYALTIRCTSLWRTTSASEKRTKAMSGTPSSTPITFTRPERWSRGRSIWVMSPVTTTFEPNPSRVRNICICSGLVFWASSRMMNESFRVRPRMNASGATSTMPLSMYDASRSASSMSWS